MKYSQRVHIIPIGDDILDRITVPPQKGHADKVIFITKEGEDLFSDLVVKAQRALIEEHIVGPEMVIVRKCDIFDFTAVLELLAELIRKEQQDHNTVFISISTGGKLMAAAAMLACFLFGAEPYFLKMHYQTMTIPLVPEIFPVPRLSFEPPKKALTATVALSGDRPTRVFAQLVDDRTGLVLGNQVTPIAVTLDGQQHTVTVPLEAVVYTARPKTAVTLQVAPTTTAYAQPQTGGSVTFDTVKIALPVGKLTPVK